MHVLQAVPQGDHWRKISQRLRGDEDLSAFHSSKSLEDMQLELEEVWDLKSFDHISSLFLDQLSLFSVIPLSLSVTL